MNTSKLSKYYSTEKSRNFINGILDKTLKDLKKSGEINKAGRGLVGESMKMKLFCSYSSFFLWPAVRPKQDKQESKNADNRNNRITKFEFNEEIHNFGPLQSGEILVYSFAFTNSGTSDLIIKNVETDCGCISTSYSEKPVKARRNRIY